MCCNTFWLPVSYKRIKLNLKSSSPGHYRVLEGTYWWKCEFKFECKIVLCANSESSAQFTTSKRNDALMLGSDVLANLRVTLYTVGHSFRVAARYNSPDWFWFYYAFDHTSIDTYNASDQTITIYLFSTNQTGFAFRKLTNNRADDSTDHWMCYLRVLT